MPREWCEDTFDPEFVKMDSIHNANMDIFAKDIHKLTPNVRFALFDACYNGSFHQDDNIAGAYIFGKGKTIATMGCTVNTIQDKWPDEFIGLMADGMRIGQFVRFTCFLENHLVGDPTFHFVPNGSLKGMDVNDEEVLTIQQFRDREFDRLATIVRQNIDMDSVYKIVRSEDVPCGRWDND